MPKLPRSLAERGYDNKLGAEVSPGWLIVLLDTLFCLLLPRGQISSTLESIFSIWEAVDPLADQQSPVARNNKDNDSDLRRGWLGPWD